MTYKELSIHEKINVKSWVKHNAEKYLPEWYLKYYKAKYGMGCEIWLTAFILLQEKSSDSIFRKECRAYPCDRETLLLRKHWGLNQVNNYWLPRRDTACTAWLDYATRKVY